MTSAAGRVQDRIVARLCGANKEASVSTVLSPVPLHSASGSLQIFQKSFRGASLCAVGICGQTIGVRADKIENATIFDLTAGAIGFNVAGTKFTDVRAICLFCSASSGHRPVAQTSNRCRLIFVCAGFYVDEPW